MNIILKSWGFPNLVDVFKQNDILTIDALNALMDDPDELKNVIPSAGVRILLKKKLREHIEVNEQIKFELSATENSLLEDSLKEEELQGLETTEEVEANDEDTIDVEYVENQTTPDGEPACKKQRISTAVNDLDLKALLEDHALGPSILRVYEAKKELCSASQSYLVEIITLHFLRDNNLRLTDHDFKVLVWLIKLVDKYRNRRTYILQSHKLSSQCQSTAKRVPVTNNLDVQSALESKEWLVINREKREVLKHWEFTFNLRQTDAKNQEYQTVADIYKNWPILEESYGFELIEKDFLQTYLNPFENICKRWNDVFSHAAAILKDKLTKDDRLILDSLEELDCESDADHGNKLSSIEESKIVGGYLSITTAEMSYLITYFGIIIGDLVPEDDLSWELYLTLFDIIDLITQASITENEISYLSQLLKSHNELYIQIFDEPLKPKHHIILHYPDCIRAMGPTKHYSCEKYEAFHKKAKQCARVVTSRIYIIHTLSTKLQLELAYRFYINKEFKNIIEFGALKKKVTENVDNEVNFVKINGALYRPNYAIFLYNDESDNPVIGLIEKIVKTTENKIFFMYKDCQTIGFLNSMKCYVIIVTI
ncbi:uncharacterized protein LOC100114950 isoform X1 [Nasonia vitripennis]|uniref:SAM domain-containing protein n=1 Tax=Nasonia vitripennis TaxID=7425 RepID=A0A7M7HAR3_NASVI|nr:uncharacterized protein LOC100114950 isoform X1 [Nasonia vitripennis]